MPYIERGGEAPGLSLNKILGFFFQIRDSHLAQSYFWEGVFRLKQVCSDFQIIPRISYAYNHTGGFREITKILHRLPVDAGDLLSRRPFFTSRLKISKDLGFFFSRRMGRGRSGR